MSPRQAPPSEEVAVEAASPVPAQSHRGGYRFTLPKGTTLPTECVHCGELGTVPITVRPRFAESGEEVTYFRCDSCHGTRERVETRQASVTLASLALSTASGAALLSSLGYTHVWFLLAAVFLLAFGPPALWAMRFGQGEPSCEKNQSELTLTLPTGLVSERLPYPRERIAGLRPRSLSLAAGFIALVVWSLILSLGRVEIYVLHHEPRSVLLVNDQVAGFPLATLVESPGAGLQLSLPAGETSLTLLSARGDTLIHTKTHLSAGGTYLFAEPPPGQCFALERGHPSQRELLTLEGGLVRLSVAPTAWLGPASSASESEFSSPAVRLVNCSSPKKT
jgi:hypothetical protein